MLGCNPALLTINFIENIYKFQEGVARSNRMIQGDAIKSIEVTGTL